MDHLTSISITARVGSGTEPAVIAALETDSTGIGAPPTEIRVLSVETCPGGPMALRDRLVDLHRLAVLETRKPRKGHFEKEIVIRVDITASPSAARLIAAHLPDAQFLTTSTGNAEDRYGTKGALPKLGRGTLLSNTQLLLAQRILKFASFEDSKQVSNALAVAAAKPPKVEQDDMPLTALEEPGDTLVLCLTLALWYAYEEGSSGGWGMSEAEEEFHRESERITI